VLVDTGTVLRTLQPLHPHLKTARAAINTLTAQGTSSHRAAKPDRTLVVATRRVEQNGLGLTPAPRL